MFNRCPNCCQKRRWHALHTFVEVFQGCYKNGVSEGWDFRSMSGVYMLFRFVLVVVNYHVAHQIGWLLCALLFLSLSILILILRPYKRRCMNVLDGLLLALLGFVTLLIFLVLIACSFPQLVLVVSVTCRQLKVKQIARHIAGKVSSFVKQICKQNQAGDELSDADSLPHRLVSPNQYNRSLLSESEQTHPNSESLSVGRQVTPVYISGSVS